MRKYLATAVAALIMLVSAEALSAGSHQPVVFIGGSLGQMPVGDTLAVNGLLTVSGAATLSSTLGVTGATTLTSLSVTSGAPAASVAVAQAGAGLAATTYLVQGIDTGTYNTTAGALTAYGSYQSITATRSAGTFGLTNVGGYFSASGGQVNDAIFADAGDVVINNTSGGLKLNPSAVAGTGAITRTLDSTGGVWNIVQLADVLEPSGPNYKIVASDALNTPLGDGSYDHTFAWCWNQGRTIATQPQSCRGDIESHWGVASEMYDTFTGTDGNEHRWIGTTARWDGTLGSSFFTGTTIAFGDWTSAGSHTFAQLNSSPTPATVAASLQLGGLQVGDLGTSLNIVDNDTSGSIVQVGTTTVPNKYFSMGSAGTTLQAATNGGSVLTLILQQAGQDAIFTLRNAAGAALSIAQRSGAAGTVDMVAGGNNIRCWPGGSGHCQSIGPVDFEDTFGNIQLSFNPTTFVTDVQSGGMWGWSSTTLATGAVDTALARNGAGIVEVNNGTAGTLRDLTDRNEIITGTAAISNGSGSTTPLGISGTTQLVERIRLSGQEYLAAAHTDTNGPAFLLGLNRTNDRRVWLVDSANEAQNATNTAMQFAVGTALGGADISALSTDGTTNKILSIQGTGGGATEVHGLLQVDSTLTVQGATTHTGSVTVTNAFAVLATSGHIESLGTTLSNTNLSACGTGTPTMAVGSTDVAGQFTEGTTTSGCTLTFAGTYTRMPWCTCTGTTSGGAATNVDCGKGTTATTMVVANASATGDVITYHCIGQPGSS